MEEARLLHSIEWKPSVAAPAAADCQPPEFLFRWPCVRSFFRSLLGRWRLVCFPKLSERFSVSSLSPAARQPGRLFGNSALLDSTRPDSERGWQRDVGSEGKPEGQAPRRLSPWSQPRGAEWGAPGGMLEHILFGSFHSKRESFRFRIIGQSLLSFEAGRQA